MTENPNPPRELTTEECKQRFLETVAVLCDYWTTCSVVGGSRERIEGLAFSMLSMIDGVSAAVPGFILAPTPHPRNKPFLIKEGENWWPENDPNSVKANIAGSLHDDFYATVETVAKRLKNECKES